MKTRTILLGSAAVALAASMTAPAQATHFHGWYVGLEGGANWVQDYDFTSASTFFTPHTHFDTANFDTGWAVLATVGYAFSNWRVELEGGYRDNDVDKFTTRAFGLTNTFSNGASLREITIMANVHYDIPLTSKLMFSIGAGAGGDRVDFQFGGNPGADVEEWKFAYQGIAGLSYAIGSRTDLTLNYRYLHVDNVDPGFGPFNTHTFAGGEELVKHTVTIGLRYDLWPDEEPIEVAAPPPPPPPAEPPPAHFVIFFGFNKCNITAEADNVLSEAAGAAKSMGSASVSIVGHTDTSGSQRYNQKLSECRAHAAATNLEGKGVPRGAISTTGKGETELMVQTGDGVKEPQNRRATVDLN